MKGGPTGSTTGGGTGGSTGGGTGGTTEPAPTGSASSGVYSAQYDAAASTLTFQPEGQAAITLNITQTEGVSGFKTATGSSEGTYYVYQVAGSENDYLAFGTGIDGDKILAGSGQSLGDLKSQYSVPLSGSPFGSNSSVNFGGLKSIYTIQTADGTVSEETNDTTINFNPVAGTYSGNISNTINIAGDIDGGDMSGTATSGDMSGTSQGIIGYSPDAGSLGTLGTFQGDNGSDSAFAGGWQGAT